MGSCGLSAERGDFRRLLAVCHVGDGEGTGGRTDGATVGIGCLHRAPSGRLRGAIYGGLAVGGANRRGVCVCAPARSGALRGRKSYWTAANEM